MNKVNILGVNVDKITYTDATISLFTITNGKDGNGISAINKISSSVVDGRNQTKYTCKNVRRGFYRIFGILKIEIDIHCIQIFLQIGLP